MNAIASALTLLVAAFHLGFLILEMFLWRKPIGLRVFRMSQAKAEECAVLAANQGLYNGFLAAGLIWSYLIPAPSEAHSVRLFFLGCVTIAGIYGAATVNRRIFFIQSLPAIGALLFSVLSFGR